jgi:2-amino-4-hydroxy-6-hydroxymethyldihydropteridine diphosphokinase
LINDNIFLGLGSNKGDRLNFLKQAAIAVNSDVNCRIEIISSVYESEPYGHKHQENFLNAVIKISSTLSVRDLGLWIKNIEKEIGRIPGEKWGPREIDIDLLFYGDAVYEDGSLIVPHKELLLRDFVVVPMNEIAPDFVHPVGKIKMKDVDLNSVEKLIFNTYKVDILNQ